MVQKTPSRYSKIVIGFAAMVRSTKHLALLDIVGDFVFKGAEAFRVLLASVKGVDDFVGIA